MIQARIVLAVALVATFVLGCSQNESRIADAKTNATSAQDSAATTSSPNNSIGNHPTTNGLIEECKQAGDSKLILPKASSRDLLRIASLDGLEVLEISQADFESEDLETLSNLTRLKRLRLEDLAATDETVEVLSEFVELEILNLPASRIGDAGFQSLISKLPQLTLLRIGGTQLSDRGISSIRSLPNLRFLHLVHVPITDAGLQTFHQMHDLESLYIDGDHATDDGIQQLLKANPGLHFHRNQTHVADDPNADGH